MGERVGREGPVEEFAHEFLEVLAVAEWGQVGVAAGVDGAFPSGGDGLAERLDGLGGQGLVLVRVFNDRDAQGQVTGDVIELDGIPWPQSLSDSRDLHRFASTMQKPQAPGQELITLAQGTTAFDDPRFPVEGNSVLVDGFLQRGNGIVVLSQDLQDGPEVFQRGPKVP